MVSVRHRTCCLRTPNYFIHSLISFTLSGQLLLLVCSALSIAVLLVNVVTTFTTYHFAHEVTLSCQGPSASLLPPCAQSHWHKPASQYLTAIVSLLLSLIRSATFMAVSLQRMC
jgi:hypothetical protein